MRIQKLKFSALSFLFILLLALAVPSPVLADGGPIVPRDLWAELEEGHQIGVVTIIDENHASVDLFISILDNTGVSHEITFFVPIGKNTTDFTAFEKDLFAFDKWTTKPLDKALRDGAADRQHALEALFAGALLTNGAILVPFWAPVLLTGCAAATPQPDSVVTTDSSEISIYGIDDNTDLNALIETAGLPDSVLETLNKLKGQQIAIVKLQTKAKIEEPEDPDNPWEPAPTEPGLHLSWSTELIATDSGKTISFPLGTGAAWSKPIELTRVYIVAPKGMDFDADYPKLGEKHSGFDFIEGSLIEDYLDTPAYAIDETRSDTGRIWRATYTQSNPTDDVVITVKAQSGFSRFLAGMETGALGYSIVFAIFIGIIIWVLAFRFLMPVFVGKAAEYALPGWYEALIYPGINLVFIIFPGAVLYLVFLLGAALPALAIQFLLGAGISIGIFMAFHSKKFGVTRGKALSAFILTSICGSGAYLLLAIGFAFLVNAL